MIREVIKRGMKRRPGGAKMTYRRLTAAAVLPVIEKDLKLVCQESAMVVRFHPRGLFQHPDDDTSITRRKDGTPRNTQLKDQICKYGSTNMQCQLLVIILMMMKAVKILIHNLIGILYHFFVRSNNRLLITFLSLSKVF